MENIALLRNMDIEGSIFKRDLDLVLNIYEEAVKIAGATSKPVNENSEKEARGSHEENQQSDFHFAATTLHALFITAYSIVETYLYNLCRQLEMYSDSRIRVEDISKGEIDLDGIRKYLDKVFDLRSAKKKDSSWKKLRNFQKVRNLILHKKNRFKGSKGKKDFAAFLNSYHAFMPKPNSLKITDGAFLEDFKKITSEIASNIIADISEINEDNLRNGK